MWVAQYIEWLYKNNKRLDQVKINELWLSGIDILIFI